MDSLIRDRIVVGIKDNGSHKRLLQEAKLTLNTCIVICRSSEATAAQLQAMGTQEDLKFVADDKQKFKSPEANKNQDKGGKAVISCKFCGKKHVRSKEDCPAWGKSCSRCRGKNHFAVKCTKPSKSSRPPKKKMKTRKPVHAMQEDSSCEEYLLTVSAESLDSVDSQKLYAKMVVNGHDTQFQLDSWGNSSYTLQESIRKFVMALKLKASEAILSMYNGTEICPLGKRRISLRNPKNNTKYNLKFQIVSEENKPVLGASAVQGMELITVNMQNILTVDG